MLEPPELPEEQLRACLRDAYGFEPATLAFLPLGADTSTAVYRAVAPDGEASFIKLRRGAFNGVSVTFPRWLSDRGMETIIPPLPTTAGQLWTQLGPFTVVRYPFVTGADAYGTPLSERQWHSFGAAVRQLHSATPPAALGQAIRHETYGDEARRQVRALLAQLPAPPDAIAARAAVGLQAHRETILALVERAETLARRLRHDARPTVICHGDLHAGNLLIDAEGHLYLVDWDTLIRAPRERDLMFIGGGQGFVGVSPDEETRLFYAGYGPAQLDQVALAYYRYERIVQDIAAFGEELILGGAGGADREQSLRYLMTNFAPGGTIAIATGADTAR